MMISSHPGIYSLGLLVTLGVGSVLIASLSTLPGLLALLARRQARQTEASGAYQDTTASSYPTQDEAPRPPWSQSRERPFSARSTMSHNREKFESA
jgi:uncharacterized membrane protein YdfJ with MMPL/SSD domain